MGIAHTKEAQISAADAVDDTHRDIVAAYGQPSSSLIQSGRYALV